ncbi:MAG: hypothetical protein J6Y64_07805, partial [Ruminococcus sp.]|nr:hypothetical protein [Ruminococcus sp.]
MNKRKILTFITALTMGLTSRTLTPAYVVAEDSIAVVSASEDNVVKVYGDIVFQSSRIEKSVYAGEKVSFDDIELRVANYLDSNDPDASIIPEIDSFTVGSGKYSDLYTLDTSDVDTTQTGQYLIKLRPKAGSSLKVST